MAVRMCSGRLLRRALFVGMLATALAYGQAAPKPVARKTASHRTNELTLAGLRPGRDTLEKAARLNGKPGTTSASDGSQTEWRDACRNAFLTVDTDGRNHVQVIRTGSRVGSGIVDCKKLPPGPWKTGLGLRVWDSTSRVLKLYGEPDSRSPSTKGGQPLELWYYAFDWAGAGVPQVMEVLCTREADGKPGRVVEITLAGPSL
jgi:hypothetical protein